MQKNCLNIRLLDDRYSVCRLGASETLPMWAQRGEGFCSITRTAEALSVVCAERLVPVEVCREGGWRMLMVEGPLDFALTGVLEAVAAPLAEAAISIFALSTFDTDYVLVKESTLEAAVAVLRAAGHVIR